MKLVPLPPGVTVYARGRSYLGEIPSDLCPLRYREGGKSSEGRTKPKSGENGKSAGTGGK